MEKDRPVDKQRCKAMIDAKIEQPDSKAGIDFCVNQCPYSYCVPLEYKQTAPQLEWHKRRDLARKLRKHKVSVGDIALILGVSTRAVGRYLKK